MRNTILLTIIGLLFPILTDAQSNKINQDSITFHQSFITDNSLDDIKPQSLVVPPARSVVLLLQET